MIVVRCDRCGKEDVATSPAMLRGAGLDLCDPCTDAVIGDRAQWASPPPEQGDGGPGRRITRPPVHGQTRDAIEAAQAVPVVAEPSP